VLSNGNSRIGDGTQSDLVERRRLRGMNEDGRSPIVQLLKNRIEQRIAEIFALIA
jgi:hypothetical protein